MTPTVRCALAGALLFPLATMLAFGPAQGILANPAWQSAKVIAVFTTLEPLPRIATTPVLVLFGFAGFGILHGAAFAHVVMRLARTRRARALLHAAMVWALSFLWFEFFILWNVLHEPIALIALELALWLAVCLVEGAVFTRLVPAPSAHGSSGAQG